MARRKKLTLEDYPKPGAVFAMPLADGRTGICRVLRVELNENRKPHALIAASDWIGAKLPPIDDPAIRHTLVLTHHSWNEEPEVLWVGEPPPPKFLKIGEIKLTAADKKRDSNSYSAWESLAYQVLAQWRWEHDREALLREDAKEATANQKKQAQMAADRTRYLAQVTFRQLLSTNLFPAWEEHPPYPTKKFTRDLEKLVKDFIRVLAQAEKPLQRELVATQLKNCVHKINALDGNNGCIETVEREDLFDRFEEILHASKQPDLLQIVDDLREW